MKLTFLGANHEVTGSCTLLEAAGQRYLIDCGMEQGKDTYENQPIPVAQVFAQQAVASGGQQGLGQRLGLDFGNDPGKAPPGLLQLVRRGADVKGHEARLRHAAVEGGYGIAQALLVAQAGKQQAALTRKHGLQQHQGRRVRMGGRHGFEDLQEMGLITARQIQAERSVLAPVGRGHGQASTASQSKLPATESTHGWPD